MKTINIGKHNVEIYDAIEELPMLRFHKYNKMLLIDAGIGSDLADFDRHIEKAMIYARSKTPELTAVELDNLRQNVYFIQNNLSPRHLAFAVLVTKIDGEEITDISDDALQKTIERLNDVSVREITTSAEEAKKKIDEELQTYFPTLFVDSDIKEYYDELKRRTLAVLDMCVNGRTAEKEDKIREITELLITYHKPKTFTGEENFEIQYDKQFERMSLLMSQELNITPKAMSVLEYYHAYEYIKEMAKKREAEKKKIK